MPFIRPATNVTLSTRQHSFHTAILTAFKTDFYTTFPSDYLVFVLPRYPGSVLNKVRCTVPSLGARGAGDYMMGELGKRVLCNQTLTACRKARDNILLVAPSSYGNMQMKEQIAHATKWVGFLFPSFNRFLAAI